LVPNIVTNWTPYSPDNPSRKSVQIIEFEDYARFAQESFDLLSARNSKPIFMPISLRLSMTQIENLLKQYLKREQVYFWIDFESKPVNEITEAKLHYINGILRKNQVLNESVLFATNIKREIISHYSKNESPASDVLAPICGVSLIGVDRDPPKPISDTGKAPNILREHKARVFDEESYYYRKSVAKIPKTENITDNALRLSKEFERQQAYFLDNNELLGYLQKKRMLQENDGGSFLNRLFGKRDTQKTLF
jgi:hypothetical protein